MNQQNDGLMGALTGMDLSGCMGGFTSFGFSNIGGAAAGPLLAPGLGAFAAAEIDQQRRAYTGKIGRRLAGKTRSTRSTPGMRGPGNWTAKESDDMGNTIKYMRDSAYRNRDHIRNLKNKLREALPMRNNGHKQRRYAKTIIWTIRMFCHTLRCRPHDARPCHCETRPR